MMLKRRGWIKENSCGCSGKGREWRYTDLRSLCVQLLADSVLAHPIDNFGRFNRESRLIVLSSALALYDAGIVYGRDRKQDIGIVGTSTDGSLSSNLDYFRDYASCGRTLGRGNLFIYTLASSPLAESSIHFGLQGPLVFLRYADDPEERMLAEAEFMIRNGDASALLAIVFDSQKADCHYLSGGMP
ncbi:MAG: hypothetical protein PHC33_05400 [Candidatus Omnitrophica bacterium]|nr:hypothetical protein [Candidatus Omnitrophota bacterium]